MTTLDVSPASIVAANVGPNCRKLVWGLGNGSHAKFVRHMMHCVHSALLLLSSMHRPYWSLCAL